MSTDPSSVSAAVTCPRGSKHRVRKDATAGDRGWNPEDDASSFCYTCGFPLFFHYPRESSKTDLSVIVDGARTERGSSAETAEMGDESITKPSNEGDFGATAERWKLALAALLIGVVMLVLFVVAAIVFAA